MLALEAPRDLEASDDFRRINTYELRPIASQQERRAFSQLTAMRAGRQTREDPKGQLLKAGAAWRARRLFGPAAASGDGHRGGDSEGLQPRAGARRISPIQYGTSLSALA